MTSVLGVGIVGLGADGGWAARAHLPALRALDGFEVRGLSSRTSDSAARSAAVHGIPFATADPAELAARPEIDLVVVCVRVPEHRRLVEAVVGSGTALHCEWPLARTPAEAEHLAQLAHNAGVQTAVGLQARSTPTVRHLRDLVAGGYVGTVLSTTLVGAGGGWGPTTTSRSAYTYERANGATLLTVPFGHTLDALQFVLGDLAEVTATTAVRRGEVLVEDTGERVPVTAADQIALSARLHDGAVLAAHYRGGTSAGTGFRWEINGTDGDLVLTGPNGHLQFDQAVLAGSRHGAPLRVLDVPALSRWSGDELAGSPARPVAYAYHQLRHDLCASTRLIPDFAEAVAHHRTLDTIERAADEGVRISVPPRDRGVL